MVKKAIYVPMNVAFYLEQDLKVPVEVDVNGLQLVGGREAVGEGPAETSGNL